MAGLHRKPRTRKPLSAGMGVAALVSSVGLAATTTYGFTPITAYAGQPLIASVYPRPITDGGEAATRTDGSDSLPAFVRIPALGTTSPLVRLGLNADGSLEVPVDFSTAGWFTGSPVPGAKGPAVIAGHVDSVDGAAVFADLARVTPGDKVEVTRVDGRQLTFAVDRIDQFPKDYFPTEQVYGETTVAELRLITCGGPFDRSVGSYRDNVVVYAHLVSGPSLPVTPVNAV